MDPGVKYFPEIIYAQRNTALSWGRNKNWKKDKEKGNNTPVCNSINQKQKKKKKKTHHYTSERGEINSNQWREINWEEKTIP